LRWFVVSFGVIIHILRPIADLSHAIAVWSDAQLSNHTKKALAVCLVRCHFICWIGGATAHYIACLVSQDDLQSGNVPAWINVPQPEAAAALARHWKAWAATCSKSSKSQLTRLLELRREALSVAGTGHGRAGVSQQWRDSGVSSVAAAESRPKYAKCAHDLAHW